MGECPEVDNYVLQQSPVINSGGRWRLCLRGVFAGNIFDLGAASSAALYDKNNGASSSFSATRDGLLPRPWAVDDFDQIVAHVTASQIPYSKVLMFV